MGKTMPVTVAGFGDLIDRVDDGLRRLERLVRRIFADCERLLPLLGPLGKQVRRLLDQLKILVKRVFDQLGKYIAAPGNPIALWQSGNVWANDVVLHVSNPVGKLTLDFMHSDDDWQGPAAAAYRNTLPPQRRALQQIQATAAQIGDSLHDIAVRLATFWVGVAAALLSLLGEMIAAGALTVTVAGAPVGLTAAAASTSKFLATMAGLVLAVTTLLTSILQAQSRLSRELANNAAFPGPPTGRWPIAVTSSFNDGSMTDGDRTDWRLQP
jgi:hypothetical protein